MNRIQLFLISAYMLTLPLTLQAQNSERSYLQIQLSGISVGYNTIAIPGDSGTRFDLVDLSTQPLLGVRLEGHHHLHGRHGLRWLVAPLSYRSSGQFSRAILYQGETFSAADSTTVDYKFNSYRLSYTYSLLEGRDQYFDVGFTGKIRDASIKLTQNSLTSEKTNVGFVPLLYALYGWSPSTDWLFEAQMDALAAPQGRAIEVSLALLRKISNRGALSVGYRILEGGADNDEVYNFSLFHQLFLGLRLEI